MSALWLTLSFVTLVAQGQADRGQDYQQSVDQIGREINKISENLNANKTLLKTEYDSLEELEQEIQLIKRQQQTSNIRIDRYRQTLVELEERGKQLGVQQATNRTALAKLIRSRYLNGEPNYLKMLLNQENPYAVGRLSNYYDYFSQAQRMRLETIQKQIQEINRLRVDKQTVLEQLRREQEKQSEQSNAIAKAKRLRERRIAKLINKVSASGEKLKKLEKDRKRLNSLIRQIAIQAKKLKRLEEQRRRAEQSQPSGKTSQARPLVKGGFSNQKGRLIFPVKAPLKYRFGDRIVESGMRAQGLFFQTDATMEVTSIYRGRVLFADYLKGYGVLLIIDHGDDHISLYGHNEVIYKNVGDRVETNEIISKSGESGGLKSAGLYFEIRKNTSPINPMVWFQ